VVCKFASTCKLYQKSGVTCNKDNGGPFSWTGKAYCGFYNVLKSTPKNSNPILVEA
jgi:hypothetical protein